MKKTVAAVLSIIIVLVTTLPIAAHEYLGQNTRYYESDYTIPCPVCGSTFIFVVERPNCVLATDPCPIHTGCLIATSYRVSDVYCLMCREPLGVMFEMVHQAHHQLNKLDFPY